MSCSVGSVFTLDGKQADRIDLLSVCLSSIPLWRVASQAEADRITMTTFIHNIITNSLEIEISVSDIGNIITIHYEPESISVLLSATAVVSKVKGILCL